MADPDLDHIALQLAWRFHGLVSPQTAQRLMLITDLLDTLERDH